MRPPLRASRLRFTVVLCVAVFFVAQPSTPAFGQSDHCKSSKHVVHDGAIHGVTIEDVVDRDGDGYASSFTIRLQADSRQSQPRQQGKGLWKAFHAVFTNKIGVPLPFTANKRCLDLVPGHAFALQTDSGEWIDWGHRHINEYDQYPSPGQASDEGEFYMGPFKKKNDEGDILLWPRRPDDGEPRTAFENNGSLTNGDRAVLTTMQVTTCWKPMGRMKAADEDLPKVIGCVDPHKDYGDDLTDTFREAIANYVPTGYGMQLVDLTERFDGGLKVEVPRLDQEDQIEPERTRTISGMVFDAKHGHEVSRAEIVFELEGGNVTRTATSSTDGTYSAELLLGTYEVEVDQDLYHAATTTVVVSKGSNTTVNFDLEPDEKALATAERTTEAVERGRADADFDRPTQNAPEPGERTPQDFQERVENLAGSAADFSGVWDTKHGELRLHQVQGYVIGDYADEGVVLGTVQDSCVAGVFTNDDRSGRFRFVLQDEDTFDGRWAWQGEPLQNYWNGDRVASDPPTQLHNFTRGDGTTQRIDNDRAVYDGVYQSDAGRVELFARDLFLIGDYADDGIIAGMWDGNSFVGRFTDEGRTGWFDLAFYSENGSLREGSRGWVGEDRRRDWSLEAVSGDTPSIDNPAEDVSCPSGQ